MISRVALLAAAPAFVGGSQAADEATLLDLESVWNEAHVNGDAEALARLWSDDIEIIVPRMPPISKTEALSVLRSGRLKFESYSSSRTTCRIHGDLAVVTGEIHRARRMTDRLVEDAWRFTKVYSRSGSTWKAVSFHASDAGRQ